MGDVQCPSVSSKHKKKTCDVSTSNLLFIVAMDSIERMLQVKFFLIHAGHTSLGSLWNITIVRGNGMEDLRTTEFLNAGKNRVRLLELDSVSNDQMEWISLAV